MEPHPNPSTPAAVGSIVHLPLAELQLYTQAREIDAEHVGKLVGAIADTAEILSEPLQVYFDVNAPTADPKRLGAYVVLNGAHRVQAMRSKNDGLAVPCVVVQKPLSADDSFLQATAANTRAETARSASFSDKVESMVAARDHLQSSFGPITSIRELKLAAKQQAFALPGFATGPDAYQVFKTSLGLRGFTRAELKDRSTSGVDTRAYECFLAFSGRAMELELLVDGKEQQMYGRFDAKLSTTGFRAYDVSLVYAVVNVPGLLNPDGHDKLTAVLYLLVLARMFTAQFGAETGMMLGAASALSGPRPPKRAKSAFNFIPVRSPEFAQGSAELRARERNAVKERPAEVLSKRVGNVVKAFNYVAVRCDFDSVESMLLPVMAWNTGAMQLSVLPTGQSRMVSAGLRWTLYGSKVFNSGTVEAAEVSSVPSHSRADEAAVLRRILSLPEEGNAQLRSLATTFLREVWQTSTDKGPEAKEAKAYADFASLDPSEIDDSRLPGAVKQALKSATALVVTQEATSPIAPGPSPGLGSEQEHPPHQNPEMPVPAPPSSSGGQAAASVPQPRKSARVRASRGSPLHTEAVVSSTVPSCEAGASAAAGSGQPGLFVGGVSVQSTGTGPNPSPVPAVAVVDAATITRSQAGPSAAFGSGKRVGFVHSDAFPWQLDRSGFESWHRYDALKGRVQLVLTDPPYGVRSAAREPRGGSSAANPSPIEHDNLSNEQIGTASEKIIELLRPGGHAVVFCSVQQFPTWVSLLGKDGRLNVDQVPMLFPKAPSSYFSFPRKSTTLVSCYEFAVHATKSAKDFKTAEGMVNYKEGMATSRNRYAGWTNIVENGGVLGRGERMFMRDSGHTTGNKAHLRPEQKSVLLLQELVHRFSQPQDTVVDLFAGTASTAVACMSMPEGGFRKFAGCELDVTCWKAASDRIKEAFAMEIGRDNLHGCTGSNRESVKQECEAILAGGRSSQDTSKEVNPYVAGLPGHSSLPMHLLSYLAMWWKDEGLLSKVGVPPPEWPEKHQSLRLGEVWEELLAVDAVCQGLRIGESGIPGAGEGVFATRTFRKGDTVCWYGGTYVYENLSEKRSKYQEWGPVGFGVTRLDFESRGLEIDLDTRALHALAEEESTRAIENVWVVASKFCVGGKVNDPKVVTGVDKVSQSSVPRKPNAEFYEVDDIDLDELKTNPYLALVRASSDIAAGDEILVSYGAKFWKD